MEMIYSMTGFGRAEYEDKNIRLSVEIKSLNHRFFEVAFYMPEGFGIFEERLRDKISFRIKRGRIFLNLYYRGKRPDKATMIINQALAKKVVQDLRQLKNTLKINGQININDIINLPNVIKAIPENDTKFQLWPKIDGLIDKAMSDLLQMRRREGLSLFGDLDSNIKRVQSSLKIIEAESPRIINRFQNKLQAYLKKIDYSSEKLVEEVGVFSRSIDISEEVVRLKSHLKNFHSILNSQAKEKGRSLDFLAQEMQREINTIGAKSSSVIISKQVVSIKSAIDKIREQLSNIE